MTKYVLCRPQNGLNDILTQIERCCRYAEKFGRQVIVDTAFCNTLHFKDQFSNYFVSRQRLITLDNPFSGQELDAMSVYPAFLKGKVSRHDIKRDEERRRYFESNTERVITFDFKKDYAAQVLVHSQGGGSASAQFLFLRLRLHDRLTDLLVKRLQEIGQPYAAVHVRNTDMKTNYADVLEKLAGTRLPVLFVATDNGEVLEDFRAKLKRTKIFSFASLPGDGGRPLHINPSQDTARQLNSDALLDLLTLASARQLTICRTLNAPESKFSRFSLLAKRLHRNRALVNTLVQRLDYELLFETMR